MDQWVKENSHKSSPLILSASARNAYYAGGKHVQMENINATLTVSRATRADYILITYREHKTIEKELLQFIKDKNAKLDNINQRKLYWIKSGDTLTISKN